MTTTIAEPVRMDTLTVSTTFTPPNGVITNTHVSSVATDRIGAEKVEQQKTIIWSTATSTTTVAAVTKSIFLANSTGTIEAVSVRPEVAPTGGDLAFTVDIKKAANASGSYTTILSSVITVDSTSVDYTVQNGTINTSTFAAGDAFEIVVAVSGSTGSQGAGATVIVVVNEEPT